MTMICVNVSNVSCRLLAPMSEDFSANVYKHWGYGGIAFLTIPAVLTVVMLGLYAEELYYIFLKSDSKDLRNSLSWLLGMYPAVMMVGTLAIFIPRAVVYLSFIYEIYVAYAIYKYYYLIMVFAGGSQPFVDKSSDKLVALNQVPCCCLVCLPKVRNTMRTTEIAKWLILQNVVCTPLYGALGVLLKSDGKLYSITGVSASVYLSIFNSIATLLCMYGFKLISQFTKSIDGMEEVHAIKGKTRCVQLTMFVTGFEGIIFNVLAQLNLFPCQPPLDFVSRRRAIFNYAVVYQVFLLGLMARYYFRRRPDIQRQAILHDGMSMAQGDQNVVFTAVEAYQRRSYNGAGTTSTHLEDLSIGEEIKNTDDVSSASA